MVKSIEEYYCEKCNELFFDKTECVQHELQCKHTEEFVCDKCGESTDITGDEHGWKSEGCHHFNLGRMGYGSGLDGCDVEFQICDDCLIGFIDSFTVTGQEKVINSGSNCYLSSDQWIRMEKGEMSDEEKEELGCYSDRQIEAYEERYPVCKHVEINVYSDDSRGSKCFRNVFGDKNGGSDHQPSIECFECDFFEKRKDGEEIKVVKNKHY